MQWGAARTFARVVEALPPPRATPPVRDRVEFG